jgi:hypothetical protein
MLARAPGAWEAAKAHGARTEGSEYAHRVLALPSSGLYSPNSVEEQTTKASEADGWCEGLLR